MAIYKRDILNIDLETGNIYRSFLKHSIGYKDKKADHFGVRVFRDGAEVDLSSVSVQGIFMPPQGDPIAITTGNIITGNVAEVVLPQACYNYDGQFCLAIKLVDSNNNVTGTVRIVDGVVDNTHASGTVAPTSAVPTYQEILATYDAMVAATAAANGAIAVPYASLTFPVKVGQYTIVDGALKRAIVDIPTSEVYTAAHWTNAKIGPDVSDLKSAMNEQMYIPDQLMKEIFTISSNDIGLVQGSINGENQDYTSSTTRVRSMPIYIQDISRVMITVASGYATAISEWGERRKPLASTGWATGTYDRYLASQKGGMIIILVKKTDDSTITADEAKAALTSIKLVRKNLTDRENNKDFAFAEKEHDGGRSLNFIFGEALNSQNRIRACTGYIAIDDSDIAIECDANDSPVRIIMAVYDKDFTMLGEIGSITYDFRYLHMAKSKYPTAKWIRVYMANRSNTNTNIQESDIVYANQHYRLYSVKPKKTPKSHLIAGDITNGNTLFGASNTSEGIIYQAAQRATTKKFYINGGELLVNAKPSDYKFYVTYYDSDLIKVKDSDWQSRYYHLSDENYPYYKITMALVGGDSTPITDEIISDFAENILTDANVLYGYSINGSTGDLYYQGLARCASCDMIDIKDAYIQIVSSDYDVAFEIYDSTGETFEHDYGWYVPTTRNGFTDHAIRLQNCKLRFVFAKNGDRTSNFSLAEYKALAEGYKNGAVIRVVESVDPDAIGEEIKNGYPEFYNSEAKATIDTLASKLNKDSIVFGMITDLHDNDFYHFSETLLRQLRALRETRLSSRLDFVICGGDLTDGAYTNKKSLLMDKFSAEKKHLTEIGVPILCIRGNHDDNSYGSISAEQAVSKDDFAQRMIHPFVGNVIQDGKAYYYHDFEELNLRVICLDYIDYPWTVDGSGNLTYYAKGGDGCWRGYSDEQIAWLCGTALNTDKRIIVTSHYSTHENLMTSWEKNTDHNYQAVSNAMIAYNARSTITFNSVTYDFGERTGKILAQITGHSHSFGAFKDNGIVWSTTGSPSAEVTNRTHDTSEYETMDARTYGDITEAHFNIFICDDNNVHIISFGQMGDINIEL